MSKEKEIEQINRCVSELVYDKTALRKAYNYYHGVRDAEQFKYLEDNFGIGTPTAVTFTPLMKKHIDVLVGEYLELEPEMTVTCKDNDTISKIRNEIFNYCDEFDVLLRRYRSDAYFLVCNYDSLQRMEDDKFSLLEKIHIIGENEDTPPTLSMAFAHDIPDINK